MIKIYVNLIKKGLKTIDDVPINIKNVVKEALEYDNKLAQ